jgi:hypothetical protein
MNKCLLHATAYTMRVKTRVVWNETCNKLTFFLTSAFVLSPTFAQSFLLHIVSRMSSIDAHSTENRNILLHTVARAICVKIWPLRLAIYIKFSLSPRAMCIKAHVCTRMNYVAGFCFLASRLVHVKKLRHLLSIRLDLPRPLLSNQSLNYTGSLSYSYICLSKPPSICTRDCREYSLRPRARAVSGIRSWWINSATMHVLVEVSVVNSLPLLTPTFLPTHFKALQQTSTAA